MMNATGRAGDRSHTGKPPAARPIRVVLTRTRRERLPRFPLIGSGPLDQP